jgi:hypothetical protein
MVRRVKAYKNPGSIPRSRIMRFLRSSHGLCAMGGMVVTLALEGTSLALAVKTDGGKFRKHTTANLASLGTGVSDKDIHPGGSRRAPLTWLSLYGRVRSPRGSCTWHRNTDSRYDRGDTCSNRWYRRIGDHPFLLESARQIRSHQTQQLTRV